MAVWMTAAEMPLGLNPIEILLHIFNFAVLIIGVRFLLYKPIKKFMDKRAAGYAEAEEERKKLDEAANADREAARKTLEEAERSAVKIEEEANAAAMAEADAIMENARKEAREMIEKAEADLAVREERQRIAMSREVTALALTMSTKILEREVKAEDNDAVIGPLIEQFRTVQSTAPARTRKRDPKAEVTGLAVEIAEKILEREVRPEDNDSAIDETIREFKKK